jgi:hypothetical protein
LADCCGNGTHHESHCSRGFLSSFSPAACSNHSRSLPLGKNAIAKSPIPSRTLLNEDLARIGVDLPVIERIVNHASGSFRGIVSTFQKYSFEPEMRKALDRWGLYVENLPRTIIARPVEAVARNPELANATNLSDLYIQGCNEVAAWHFSMESRLTKMDGRLNQLTWMVGFVGVVVLASTGLVMGIAAKLFLHWEAM